MFHALGERQIRIYHPSPFPLPRYSAARAVERVQLNLPLALQRDMHFTHTAAFSEHDFPRWIWFSSGSVALPIQDHLPSHRETSLQRTRIPFAKLTAAKVPDDEDVDAWHDWVDIAISDWTEQ